MRWNQSAEVAAMPLIDPYANELNIGSILKFDLKGNNLMWGVNRRVREGRDQCTRQRNGECDPVSIHAPVKGAMSAVMLFTRPSPSFNPRAREERDLIKGSTQGEHVRFNPRACEERDCALAPRPFHQQGFNPHAREGRDSTAIL